MTTYITITDPETDPDAPLTSELAKRWRDNALAIAEGDSTAPVNKGNWHPYNKITNGDANDGKFYDFAVDGVQANIITPNFVDGYEYRVIGQDMSHNNGVTTNFQMEAWRETSSAYNPVTSAVGNTSAVRFNFWLEMPTVREVTNFHPFFFHGSNEAAALANSVIAWDALPYANQVLTAQKILRVRFSWVSGSFDAGEMFLYRRRYIN